MTTVTTVSEASEENRGAGTTQPGTRRHHPEIVRFVSWPHVPATQSEEPLLAVLIGCEC
jgi:hypothetical protein